MDFMCARWPLRALFVPVARDWQVA